MRRPTGRVVGVIRRSFRQNYCGSIYTVSSLEEDDDTAIEPRKRTEREAIADEHEVEHSDGTTTCVFFAVDGRVPPILLRTSQRDRLLGHRILVAIDSWPVDSRYPLGHYVKTIGESGNKDVETEVLLHEHNIPCDPFPAKVLACLPPEDYKIDIDNSPGREDLRHLPVLSIDPPGCKDIDDALHCVVLPNGNYQVGVHIADVTHYVKAGTAIDLEAANRSTSTYLVNKRLDMLPGLLTTDLCSLKGNMDRYAFSVLWEVTPDAEIVDVDFKKTIIHSIAALTYQQAQALIDQPKDGGSDIQAGAVKRLASLARKLRAKRIEAGALTLASPEVKFALDSESLNPTDVQAYTLYEANAVVEEFMLFANVTVSKKILRHYPTLSVLRRHPAPNRGMFDSLISKAKCRGFAINIDDSKTLADSLDKAQIESDPYFNKLLRILSTRCMSPAQYFCSGEYKATEWHHYGLAAPIYTHFTSPIRRYADVCVHRLLAAAIGVDPLPVHLSSKSYLHDLAANMNRRHRAAQLAGRASVQLHTLIFFSGTNSGKQEDAYVLDVDTSETAEPTFTVIVPRYGIEGRVKLPNIAADDPNLIRHVEQHRVQYKDPKTGKITASVQVFEKVRVKIWVRTIQENQKELILDLIEPTFGTDKASGSVDASGKKRKSAEASSEVSSSSKSPKKKSKKKNRGAMCTTTFSK
jgi:exosome complex exonuclease DIS3/RRP44